jgi:two-component system LytT family response regulator
MKITTFVIDDEPLARRKLATLIAGVPWLEHVGEAADGASGIESVDRQGADIVFLDIRMPELSGIEVLERLRLMRPPPAVVFTTAYDKYAVTAFELEAVDYLLKPFGQRRFLAALERARNVVEMRQGAELIERARAVLLESKVTTRLERIFVRNRNAVVPLLLSDVHRIEAQDDYAMVHTRRRAYLVSLRIRDLEKRLPNPPFLRVHRSHIVNLDHVDRMVGLDDARFEVRMKDGTIVPVSRARSQEIRQQSQ